MGLLDNQTQFQYYNQVDNTGAAVNTLGDYQFTTMDNIINAFMVSHVGEGKIISRINRTDVQFHAMRAIQELSYDVFRSIKSQEIEISNTLSMMLPHDYVNYVKLSRIDSNGIKRVLYKTGKTSNPFAITQDASGNYTFNQGQNFVIDPNDLAEQSPSNTSENFENANTQSDPLVSDETDIELDSRGRRYGIDPQHAQTNGTFYIDYQRGNIHFDSFLSGKTVTLDYISDGLGTDSEMVVHKFCEEACYKWIAYGILSTRTNIPEFIVQRFKKERFAETRKAKIRLSNIKIEEFTQVLKGMGKQIK